MKIIFHLQLVLFLKSTTINDIDDDGYLFYINKHILNKVNHKDYSKCMFGGKLVSDVIYHKKNNILLADPLYKDIKNTKMPLKCNSYNKLKQLKYSSKTTFSSKLPNYIRCKDNSLQNNNSNGFMIQYNNALIVMIVIY